jgi:TonB family protein
MKNIFLFCLILLAPFAARAQGEDKSKWTRVSGPKGEFSILMPADFLVDNGDGADRAYAYEDEATIKVEIDESGGAKSRLKVMRRFREKSDWKISQFTLGAFTGDIYLSETEKYFSMYVYAASSRAFYIISISTKNKKSPAVETFLHSIKFDNLPLIKQQAPATEDASDAVLLSSLKTSPSVMEALKKPDAVKVKVKYELEEKKDKKEKDETEESVEDTPKYSRPLFVLRRPRARYSMSGRENNVQGTVNLKVVFQADGKIGEIIVIKKLDNSLTEAAVDAARGIKFLPAEIDGKTVDVTRTVAYTFTIY